MACLPELCPWREARKREGRSEVSPGERPWLALLVTTCCERGSRSKSFCRQAAASGVAGVGHTALNVNVTPGASLHPS